MLVVNNLRKKFGDRVVLDGVSATFKKGEVVAILGASGSGKSTFLRCLNYLESFDQGSIHFDGRQVEPDTIHIARARIGMVFQGFNLFPHMSVLKNLTYAPVKVKKESITNAVEKAKSLLKRVGLEAKSEAFPARLSGGEKQRIAIARALMLDPEVVLFDEPTSALDPEMVREVLNAIKDLRASGTAMLIVTHEMEFVKEVADRILFLENGALRADCSVKEFFGDSQDSKILKFLARA